MITKKDLVKAYDKVVEKYREAVKEESEDVKYLEGKLDVLEWALEQYK